MHNVALALTYALASGVSLEAAAPVLAQLTPLRRRMERYEANGRSVLDDTAAHPESLQATFEVASMLRDGRMVVVYAVRGARGAEINARNAIALADLANEHRARLLVVTAAHDLAGPADRVTGEERYAAERALKSRGRAYTWCDNLADAIGTALKETRPGDLIVLTGAQGMNEGRRLISSADTAA
jgi:UDP-N-acetylmuramoyl-L-alanyl-D-glutamate--2,6-diaminopimelate ligase